MPAPILSFEIPYQTGLTASVDWVAGGNFDGYIYQKSLTFFSENNKVVWQKNIIDQSKHDNKLENSALTGTFEFSDHGTITCYFSSFTMRGVCLGDQHQYLVFSTFFEISKLQVSECFKRSV